MSNARTAIGVLVTSLGLLLTGISAATPAAAAPVVGDCYAYRAAVLDDVSTTAPIVSCDASHTAETYRVGVLPATFGLPSKASPSARLAAGAPCTVRAMNGYLGMPERTLPSRFRTAVLFPTDDQWKAGERWVRCDVVLQGGLELKAFVGTAAALVAATPQATFNFCTPGEPRVVKTSAVPCTTPKRNWIMVSVTPLGGPRASYPGAGPANRKSAALCAKQAKIWNGTEKYPGWWRIYPTEIGWRNGDRSVYCFVPYRQYLAEVAQDAAPAPTPTPTPTPEPTPSTEPTVPAI